MTIINQNTTNNSATATTRVNITASKVTKSVYKCQFLPGIRMLIRRLRVFLLFLLIHDSAGKSILVFRVVDTVNIFDDIIGTNNIVGNNRSDQYRWGWASTGTGNEINQRNNPQLNQSHGFLVTTVDGTDEKLRRTRSARSGFRELNFVGDPEADPADRGIPDLNMFLNMANMLATANHSKLNFKWAFTRSSHDFNNDNENYGSSINLLNHNEYKYDPAREADENLADSDSESDKTVKLSLTVNIPTALIQYEKPLDVKGGGKFSLITPLDNYFYQSYANVNLRCVKIQYLMESIFHPLQTCFALYFVTTKLPGPQQHLPFHKVLKTLDSDSDKNKVQLELGVDPERDRAIHHHVNQFQHQQSKSQDQLNLDTHHPYRGKIERLYPVHIGTAGTGNGTDTGPAHASATATSFKPTDNRSQLLFNSTNPKPTVAMAALQPPQLFQPMPPILRQVTQEKLKLLFSPNQTKKKGNGQRFKQFRMKTRAFLTSTNVKQSEIGSSEKLTKFVIMNSTSKVKHYPVPVGQSTLKRRRKM